MTPPFTPFTTPPSTGASFQSGASHRSYHSAEGLEMDHLTLGNPSRELTNGQALAQATRLNPGSPA